MEAPWELARRRRRNASTLGVTVVTTGLLMLYPTSIHRGASHVAQGAAAPVGVVKKATSPAGPKALTTFKVNGAASDTAYGPVQVQLTVRGHQIIAAKAITYPNGSFTDQQINAVAIPMLEQETVQAQSARIDSISGATYTSQGYEGSLQSALDAAHLG